MIEVPARVKDALKSGDYRKNYKITLQDPLYTYVNTAHLTVVSFLYEASGFTPKLTAGKKYRLSVPKTYLTMTRLEIGSDTITAIDGGDFMYVNWVCTATQLWRVKIKYSSETTYVDIGLDINEVLDTIDNNKLVSESVKFDERMCSDTELKFGLCEGTSVEFQYFDFPNIRDHRINVELEVEYKNASSELAWYTIPMGYFEVEECSRQASTGIIKAVAYNKLQSDYLNVSIKNDIIDLIQNGAGGFTDKVAVGVVLEDLMGGYQGTKEIPITPEAISSDQQAGIVYHYRICQSDGTPTNYWLFAYCKPTLLTIENVNITNYYRFLSQNRQLCQYLEDYSLNNPVTSSNMSPLNFIVSWPGYIPPGGGSPPQNNAVSVKSGLIADVQFPNEPPKMMRYILKYKQNPEVPGDRIALDRRIYHDGYENKTENTNWYSMLKIEETLVSIGGTILCGGLMFYLPTCWMTELFPSGTSPTSDYDPFSQAQKDAAEATALNLVETYSQAFQMSLDAIEGTTITLDEALSLQDVTLRDLQSAVFEVECKYGKLSRTLDLFEGVSLNNSRLYPADTLYPADNLYPNGTAEAGYPSMYSKLWADEGNVRSFRYLNITYKTTETIDGQTQTVDKELQRTVNADGTDDYNMSDNWLFRNLTWTDAKVGQYADAMVTILQDIRWFPFEMWCAGLPFLEAGDEIEIAMSEGTYPSYILRRTLSGIQNLQDELIDGTLDIF